MRIAPDWQALSLQAARLCEKPLRELIAEDPARSRDFTLRVGALYANFSRQRYDRDALAALFTLAHDRKLPEAFRDLFAGVEVNPSERRPALHTALRSNLSSSDTSRRAHQEALIARERMATLVMELEASGVTDIVNVGIGGSDLGPRLAAEALRDFSTGRYRLHFINNADAHPVAQLLRTLDRNKTAIILVSKTFGTQETLLNGRILCDWLGADERVYAVTANIEKAAAFGVSPGRILPMWDWVGGRYSLWSSVGFALALAIGMEGFQSMLDGAVAMDTHVLESPPECNLALWHALSLVWNRNGLGLDSHALIPYDPRLELLPDYLQQLFMESLGKSAGNDGGAPGVATVPVLWGSVGTSCQHSFFQALHQGTDTVPVEFIGVVKPAHGYPDSHRAQLANLFAQAEALANGEDNVDTQRRYPGNRPSTMILLDELTPHSLGMLLAMYEHSVFALATIWGINAFDQWGVQLGKRLADGLLPALAGADDGVSDPVTRALLDEFRSRSL
jgi:glucose-6-phosphate isomerase